MLQTEVRWELIIVNNNSSNKTTEAATEEWDKYELSIPLKIVFEPTPGLTHARQKGVSESSFSYVLFCDDDN